MEKILTVDYDRLSSADQQFLQSGKEKKKGDGPRTTLVSKLSGEPQELTHDDGSPAGKRVFHEVLRRRSKLQAKTITSPRCDVG